MLINKPTGGTVLEVISVYNLPGNTFDLILKLLLRESFLACLSRFYYAERTSFYHILLVLFQ
jgi:hypothetical protein